MSASGAEMVVFGFKSGLDWLPTSFVEPFAAEKVCGVCGLVPRVMRVLPCGHRLCSVCYREVDKSHRCPLDKEAVDMKLVKRTTWSTRELKSLSVLCWNAKHGCEAEGLVSEMLLHLKTTCRYHTVRCRRCHAVVLRRRIVRHLDSDCEAYRIAASEQSVRDDAADCDQNASPPESQQLASERVGATQAVSKATFDPGADHNTSGASNDDVRDSSDKTSERALSTKTHSFKRKVDGAENVSTTSASAWTVEELVSAEKKAKRQTLPESPVEPDIGESRVVGNSTTLSYGVGKECCECTIENWSSFRSGQARALIRNGRCECNTSPGGYGFLLVPSVAMGFLCFTVHAFRDSRRTIVPFPREQYLNLRFVHPDGKSSMDLTKMKEVSWDTCSFPLKKTPHQLHVARCRDFFVTIACLQEGGFVADEKLRIRFTLS
ncbi:hypothetical protein MTO96_048102 [Rhipicephalus appendiculatus]